MRRSALVLLLAAGCQGDPVVSPPSGEDAADDGTTTGDSGAVLTDSDPSDSSATDTSVADSTAADSMAADSTAADSIAADSTAADSGSDGATMVDSGPCGVHPGPRMVQLTTSKGVFCVDTTEVSNAQFAEFSAATKPTMPPYCAFKTVYSVANPLPSARELPVVNVDWCDAYQYCAWAGKRLCGGTAGGHVVRTGTTVPEFVADSQWTLACENNVPTVYSTGATFPGGDAGVCNITNNGGEPWAVTAGASCKGVVAPFDQIVNLTGNAGEWEDNCASYDATPDAASAGATICYVRGGLPSTCCVNDFDYRCRAANIITSRSAKSPKIGFRCCSK